LRPVSGKVPLLAGVTAGMQQLEPNIKTQHLFATKWHIIPCCDIVTSKVLDDARMWPCKMTLVE
jgi:hypothetical protein